MSGERTGRDMARDAAPAARRVRADAQRNVQRVLLAAKEAFARSGVEVPVRDIADRAGVGIGTIYRHFPRRADLIAAVFRQELDACADAAATIAATHPPLKALSLWMQRFVELCATKRGIAQALHSGDPAFDALPARREQRLRPAIRSLFAAALASGEIVGDVDADDFLNAAATLCNSDPDHAPQLVALLVQGLSRRSTQ